MNNRRLQKEPAWLGWIGDVCVMKKAMRNKSLLSSWGPLKGIDCILRAIGTVAFASNPITGALILTGMVVGNSNVAIACVVAGVIALFTAKFLECLEGPMSDGAPVFNSILVGCVLCAVTPPILGVQVGGYLWALLIPAFVITCFVEQGLQALMAPSGMTAQSIPFNLIATFLFLSIRSHLGGAVEITTTEEKLINYNLTETVHWDKVFEGSVLAAGQIYGVGTLVPSVLVWLGFFIYSPLLVVFFYIGSVIGCTLGILFSVSPYAAIYEGLWGYNSLLSAGGTVYFLVPTPKAMIAAPVCAVIAVSVQAAITPLFDVTTLPVFSYPFNVAIPLILSIGKRKDAPVFYLDTRTSPEKHLYIHYMRRNDKPPISTNEDSVKMN